MIDPERWRRVEEIYHAALARADAGDRAALLAQRCADDEPLRQEVESLLAADARGAAFLEGSAFANEARRQAEARVQALVGRVMGPYRILELLGAGGMGEVYRAHDDRLDRDVAVKVLPEEAASDPAALKRFQREARIVAALSHPNILAIHDFGADGDLAFAVTELLQGETLRRRIERSPLGPREAAGIGAAIADGLAAAHEKGIVHRDLKPENVFLTADGRVKILDFGVAGLALRVAEEPAPAGDAWTGVSSLALGTPGYASPQQLRGEPPTPSDDLFSLGCVLYETVTGTRPDGTAGTSPPMPGGFERLIRRCLEPLPENRCPSASEAARALRSMADAGPGRSRRLAVIAAAAFAAAALAVYLQSGSARQAGSLAVRQQAISLFPGSHRAASFSPDGKTLAFLSEVDGVPQVWVKPLPAGEPRQLSFDEVPKHRPRWSPRADALVFSRGRGWSQDIWRVPLGGGTPVKLVEQGWNPDWSRDGRRLVFERGNQLWTSSADGTGQENLAGVPAVDDRFGDRWPAFSPDGAWIAFFQWGSGPPGDIWVVPARGGRARRLTFDDQIGGTPAWMPDGRHIVFSSLRGGSRTLWRVPLAGGAPEPLLQGAGDDAEPDVSPDGTRVSYTNTRRTFVLTSWNPSTGRATALREARHDIFAPSLNRRGDRVAFSEITADGGIHIFTMSASGGGLKQVTRAEGERNVFPQWSFDGESIYFYQIRPTVSFRRVPAGGGASALVIPDFLWNTRNWARVDPRESRVAYTRVERGRPPASVIREIATGRETLFPRTLARVRWSADGRSLIGVDLTPGETTGQASICSVEAAACRSLTVGEFPAWSSDESQVYFLRAGGVPEEREMWLRRADGSDSRLGVLTVFPQSPNFDVSPGGDVVYVRFEVGKDELWLAELAR